MFSIEGKFFRTLTKIGDFLILGILGIVFSIPLITAGASLTAMFYVGMKLVKDEEGYIFKDFFKAWKSNMKQAVVIELILAAVGAVLVADVQICMQWAAREGSLFASLLMYGCMGFLLVLAAVAIYVFPMLAKFQNSVVKMLKNALLLCMKHLPQTFIMLICTLGLAYFSLAYYPVFLLTVPVICYADSFIMVRILKPYMEPQDAPQDDSRQPDEKDT